MDRARELFERLLSFCNDVGLLGEEIDPHSGEMLGNFPQAFLGVIQAAIALDATERSMTAMEAGAAWRGTTSGARSPAAGRARPARRRGERRRRA
jgi:alpha,alpha-trehalase